MILDWGKKQNRWHKILIIHPQEGIFKENVDTDDFII